MDVIEQLKSIYTTLDAITINGNSNINRMYGCFYVLTQVIQELERQEKEEQTVKELEEREVKKQGAPVSPVR